LNLVEEKKIIKILECFVKVNGSPVPFLETKTEPPSYWWIPPI